MLFFHLWGFFFFIFFSASDGILSKEDTKSEEKKQTQAGDFGLNDDLSDFYKDLLQNDPPTLADFIGSRLLERYGHCR